MLDFCAEHNIKPNVEIIDMQDINAAYERMQKSDMKYQVMIDMGSLKRQFYFFKITIIKVVKFFI